MTPYRFAISVNDVAQERADERRKRLPEYITRVDDATYDHYTDEMTVTAADLQTAHRRAREIVRAAFDGTDLYVEPEPIGEWAG